MRFEVGQTIWIGDFCPRSPTFVTCPDCGGTGRLRVTFHDETQVSIECRNCSQGYDPPTGEVVIYQGEAKARKAVVCGFENAYAKVRWHIDGHGGGYRIVDDEAAFATEEEAIAWAFLKSGEYEKEQRSKILSKEKDARTWAWNASYHRRCIRDAEKTIAYHRDKLSVAALKAKEPTKDN